MDHLQGMPMVRRGDHHRVDDLSVKQFAIILELLWTRADFLGGEVEIGLPQIADRHHVRILLREKSVENLIAAVADADKPHTNAVIRAQ